MIIQGKDLQGNVNDACDVCVIGSGAGGAILASELADAGHSVILLEKGGYYPRETHTQTEDVMIPRLYKNSGLQVTVPSGIAVAQGSCVGGSTVVNDAVCFRTPDQVLRIWERDYGVEEIDPQHMAKYFEKVERRLSVAQVQPFELNNNNRILKEGCEKLGWKAGPNSRNCKQCRQCGLCHLGCYYGTKQSMLETYVNDFESNHPNDGKIYSDCRADKIVRSGTHAKGVEAKIATPAGKSFRLGVKSKLVIVSCGTIASSELLLQSGLDQGGQVGKRVALHPSPAVVADFPKTINGHEGIPMGYHCREFTIMETGRRGYLIESVFLAPYQFTLSLPGFQYDQKEVMKRYSHFAMAGILLHDESSGTVNLGGPYGSVLYYQLTPGDEKLMIEGMSNTARIFFAAGAERVITSHRTRTILYSEEDLDFINERGAGPMDINLGSGHPQGGNCMGGDPTSSVVDSHCKFHGFKNLFVCDASVFPTSVGVNPQLTVMGLAMRTAEHISENWSTLAVG